MRPRNLLLLRCDDFFYRVGDSVPDVSRIDPPPRFVDMFVVERNGRSLAAISGWRGALRFWGVVPAASSPDLAVCDVLFEFDESSPIYMALAGADTIAKGYDRTIPTGLMHFKPFASIARALGRPIGVAIHTSNPALWKEVGEKEGGELLAALAAQEIGELAAILGTELFDFDEEEIEVEQIYRKCWRWLRDNSGLVFSDALPAALIDYRRKLVRATAGDDSIPRVLVQPKTWARLMTWTEKMRQAPEPIGEDQAIELIYADGRHDCIRLASIFADVEGVATTSWPSSCFEIEADDEEAEIPCWRTDVSARPQIGRFLAALGSLSRVFASASELVESFPVYREQADRMSQNADHVAQGTPDQDLVVGFMSLFQLVRWEHRKALEWAEGLHREGWVPEKLELRADRGSLTLSAVLQRLGHQISNYCLDSGCRDEPFYPEDILEHAEDAWPDPDRRRKVDPHADWVRWHFERLVSAGYLKHGPEGQYRAAAGFRIHEIAVPASLPKGFPWDPSLPWSKDGVKGFLRDSLGYGEKLGPAIKDDDNAIGRKLAAAFCPTRSAKEGRLFLEQLLIGEGPSWALDLLCEYAEDYLEWSAETWPQWLRPKRR